MKEDVHTMNEPDMTYSQNYTYADYLGFNFEEMVEIIKGKIFKRSPAPSSNHQRISGRIYTLISIHLWEKCCSAFSAPFDVILPIIDKDFMESNMVVQPDIVIVCDPEKIKEKGCFGAPDWIIEILSPSTTKKDLTIKYDLYEEAGVREYWIVEPKNLTVQVYTLTDQKYERKGVYVEDDIIPCNVIEGLKIDLKEIFIQ